MPAISINLSFVDAFCYKLRDGEQDMAIRKDIGSEKENACVHMQF